MRHFLFSAQAPCRKFCLWHFLTSAQGGAGKLCLQRRSEPPSAIILQRWSRGAGRSGRDQQPRGPTEIRSAQPEAPRPTSYRHPVQTEWVHLCLWVRLMQKVGSNYHYLLLSLLEKCSLVEHMFSMKRSNFSMPPVLFLLVRQLLIADFSPSWTDFFLSRIHIDFNMRRRSEKSFLLFLTYC